VIRRYVSGIEGEDIGDGNIGRMTAPFLRLFEVFSIDVLGERLLSSSKVINAASRAFFM
jgi:hypothetical protein